MVVFAEDRSCTTQFELGEMYDRTDRASRDAGEAFKWYRRAARNGSRQAQHRLGSLYARGDGVAQDYAKAYAWCKVAAFQNSRRARRKLKLIEARMELDQLRRGRWLAQDYYDRFVAGWRK